MSTEKIANIRNHKDKLKKIGKSFSQLNLKEYENSIFTQCCTNFFSNRRRSGRRCTAVADVAGDTAEVGVGTAEVVVGTAVAEGTSEELPQILPADWHAQGLVLSCVRWLGTRCGDLRCT